MISEEDLRAAAQTVGQMPRAELQRNLARLKEARKARSQHEVLRQQAELDSLDLDQSAYEVASQADQHGDLQTAAQWYRVAAMNDFADAQFKLAEVLHALADKYLARPESRVATREELNLVEVAAHWYLSAIAAGDIEAVDPLDKLIAHHDQTRPRARTTLVVAAPDAEPPVNCDADKCALGGLGNVLELQLTEMTDHCGSCRPCQDELIKLSGHLLVPGKRPRDTGASEDPTDNRHGLRRLPSGLGSVRPLRPSEPGKSDQSVPWSASPGQAASELQDSDK